MDIWVWIKFCGPVRLGGFKRFWKRKTRVLIISASFSFFRYWQLRHLTIWGESAILMVFFFFWYWLKQKNFYWCYHSYIYWSFVFRLPELGLPYFIMLTDINCLCQLQYYSLYKLRFVVWPASPNIHGP